MKRAGILACVLLVLAAPWARARHAAEEPREDLAAAVHDNPDNIDALTAYGEYLERYGDPESRHVYRRLLDLTRASGDSARSALFARRLARLDLLAGEPEAAARDLAAGGQSTALFSQGEADRAASQPAALAIPGPIQSFARMAAIPGDLRPEEFLPALARNIVTGGFQLNDKNSPEPTEYLKLLRSYLEQSRELQALAGKDSVIRVERCGTPQAGALLRVLGYRTRGDCGANVVLETASAEPAFLSANSGFPIARLEEAFRVDKPFSYDYRPTALPLIAPQAYWTSGKSDLLEALLSDPALCRLYSALYGLDPETATALREAIPFERLKASAPVLEFYGSMFQIVDGKAAAPGGTRARAAWRELVGVAPDLGAQFYDRLISKDSGWLAAYFDALARISGPTSAYLTEPGRLKRFYAAMRDHGSAPDPARPVFRGNADLMLLTSRLSLDPDGKPHIPGGLETWRKYFERRRRYGSRPSEWRGPDDLLETLFLLCRRLPPENEPLKAFLAAGNIDRNRPAPLDAATVARLARDYGTYGSQYVIFGESGLLSGHSMGEYLDAANSIFRIRDAQLRADAAGTFQSLIGLWQILVRQGDIYGARIDASFVALATSFLSIRNSSELFGAGHAGVDQLLNAAVGPPGESAPQETLVDLLSGRLAGDEGARERASKQIERVLSDQMTASLDDLFELADALEKPGRGGKPAPETLQMASRVGAFPVPRASLSQAEKMQQEWVDWVEQHIEGERTLDIRAALEKAAGRPGKLHAISGLMAPLLRDTLVAFNYAYYSPPGGQMLYSNPLFVRSHDFIGENSRVMWAAAKPVPIGWPSNGGGRLVGSLAWLPNALADLEQNFLAPSRRQALIWADLAPQMIVGATLPRWWRVTPVEMHWAALHLRFGCEMLAEAALDQSTRREVLGALATLATPARTLQVQQLLERGEVKEAVSRIAPAELFVVARALAAGRRDGDSCVLAEIHDLARTSPTEASYAAVSRAFGTPKPRLANSYEPQLLNLRTFPTLMGYSSQALAESWESNTLYWVEIADELRLQPEQLNARIPEWTREMLEKIFAANLDDWPALLRSLHAVGEEVRARGNENASLERIPEAGGGQ